VNRAGTRRVAKRTKLAAPIDPALEAELREHVLTLLRSMSEQVSLEDLTRALVSRKPNGVRVTIPTAPDLASVLVRSLRRSGVREARQTKTALRRGFGIRKDEPDSADVHIPTATWTKPRRRKQRRRYVFGRRAVIKYSPDQERDERGRFGSGGGGGIGADTSYRGLSTAPGVDSPSMDSLQTGFPSDVYDRNVQMQYYGTGGTDHQADQESFAAVNRAQGNAEAPITIYRAEPETVTAINRGDWVTPSLTYAREHLDANLGGEGHIVSATARAGDLRWSGDSINEWGYSGATTTETTVRKYSPDQERDERGRFAGGGGGEGGAPPTVTAETIGLAGAVQDLQGGPQPSHVPGAQALGLAGEAEAGGFSVSAFTGTGPTSGYMVAGIEEPTVVKVGSDPIVTANAIEKFMDAHAGMDPNLYVGGWVNEGNLYLEPAENVAGRAEAVARGEERNQVAIWDVSNTAEIQTGGSGEFTGAGTARAGRTSDIEKARLLPHPPWLEGYVKGRPPRLRKGRRRADPRHRAARSTAEVLKAEPPKDPLHRFGILPIDPAEFSNLTPEERLGVAQAILHFSFNLEDPAAIVWAREHSSQLVTAITDSTREAIQALVTRALQVPPGTPPRELAQQIKPLIGLTARYATAVFNYQQRLITAGMASTRIDELTSAYSDRLLTSRATTIARTELLASANQGKLDTWLQASDAGLFAGANPVKEWIAAPDAEEVCAGLDGTKVPIDAEFQSELGDVDAPPLHPNCRCTMAVSTDEPTTPTAAVA